MSQELLTLKEIARRLDVPESNIRYYRDRFDDFLPSFGEGRKRRYLPEALDVFRFIVARYQEDRSTEEVGQELMERFPRQARLDQDPAQTLGNRTPSAITGQEAYDLLLRQAKTMERLSRLLSNSAEGSPDLDALRQEQAKLKKAFLLLWKSHKRSRLGSDQGGGGRIAWIEAELGRLRQELQRLEGRQRDMEERLNEALDHLKEQIAMCYSFNNQGTAGSDQEP